MNIRTPAMCHRGRRFFLPTSLTFAAAVLLTVLSAGAPAGPISQESVNAFLKHIQKSDAYDVTARQFVAKAWQQRDPDDDGNTFIAESLAVLSPDFRKGLDAYDDENYATAYDVMANLSSNDDPYLSANASVYAVKAMVEQSKLVEASELLKVLVADPEAVDLYTSYSAEMAYLRGYLALQNLRYDDASKLLREMLERFPDAGQRLRMTAKQMLAELKGREPEKIGDVADLMTFSGRRLSVFDTGDTVRTRQQRAIDLLDKLIEEAEKNEQGGGGAGGGSGGSSGSNGNGKSPSNPMNDSSLPGGGGGGVHLRSNRRARPGEEWGSMPPAEREKILQSLRDSFPSHYRKLVEQYYEELAKKP